MGNWRWMLALSFGVLLGASAIKVGTAAPATAATAASGDVIAQVEKTYQGVTSIRAEFTQVVKNPSMGTEEKQKGKIVLERPRKMRFDLSTPPRAFVSNGKTLWIYDSATNQVIEQADAGVASDSGMGVLLDDLSRLREVFNVTVTEDQKKGTFTLDLLPKKAGGFKQLRLTMDRSKYTPQSLEIVDQMGTVTQMSFSGVKLNQDVPDSEFVFVPPAGAKVIKQGAP